MSEIEPEHIDIDNLLHRSLAAPLPSLSAEFEGNLLLQMTRQSKPLDSFSRILLGAYICISVVVCIVIMQDQGLSWPLVCGLTLIPACASLAALRHRQGFSK